MRIPLSEASCRRISEKAVQYARENIAGRGWSGQSLGALSAMPSEGWVGIRTSVKYLMRQNQGFPSFIMWWVDDKTLPLGCKVGDGPHFRRGKDPGKPGYVDIPHVGRVWRDQKWRHPGLKPKNFMQDAITRAISEERDAIKKELMEALKGTYRG